MELRFRAMERTERDLALFKDAFERNGSPRTMELLRWQYLNNPTGRINVEFALPPDESRVAAIYSVMPIDLKVGDSVLPACQSLDTLTDAEFRGKGLFVKMAKVVFERAKAEQYACVYGFPNGNSAHGFFERLGWTKMDPVPFLFKPLRLNYGLRKLPRIGAFASKLPQIPLTRATPHRLPANREFRAITSFDSAYDDLWRRFSTATPIAIERGSRYLNWRLVEKPHERYSRIALFENGRLRGFVAWAVKDKHGGSVGYLMELIADAPDVSAALLDHATSEMYQSGAEVVLAWCLDHSPTFAPLRAAGFWPLPEKLRPIELHYGARALAAPDSANLCNRWNWYLSYLDSDTV